MKQYIVNAFADRVFGGNPAAVCIMDHWPEEELLTAITMENNLQETAFMVQEEGGWHIRWITRKGEIDLCGHATLAAAHVITAYLSPGQEEMKFLTRSGPLTVFKRGDLLEMDFPSYPLKRLEVTDDIVEALGARPMEVWRARDLMCVFERPEEVIQMEPDMDKLLKVKGALMNVTAPGMGEYDCVSRTFSPKMGLPENPACGSGHCHIIPYWAQRLGKSELVARQASKRGGTLYCRLEGDRIMMAGRAVVYACAELLV